MLALALLLTAMMASLTLNIYWHALYRMSLHVKSTMLCLIYGNDKGCSQGDILEPICPFCRKFLEEGRKRCQDRAALGM